MRTALFRISFLNGLSVVIKIGIGLLTSKLFAIFVGPSGLAILGNLRNFLTSAESIATLGFQNGIVKYIAENKLNPLELKKIVSTVFFSFLIICCISSCTLFFLANYWTHVIFDENTSYSFIFKALAITLPLMALSTFGISLVNGLSKFNKVVIINILGNLIGFVLTAILIWKMNILGALLAMLLSPAILFFVTFYFVKSDFPIFKYISIRNFDSKTLLNFGSYSLMVLVSAVVGPIVYISIRNHLIDAEGIEAGGFWEAVTRISTYYLMFISTLLAVYFLPKLSTAKKLSEIKKLIRSYFLSVMPIFVAGAILIFLLRHFIIRILFTSEFEPVNELFFWQLLGDIFKASALIFGYLFFAKKLTIAFIVTEFMSFAVLYASSIFAIDAFGTKGVVMAHAFTYFIYLITLMVYFSLNRHKIVLT